jgi:Xaa-Pro aminopeptidase
VKKSFSKGDTFGVDPFLCNVATMRLLKKSLDAVGAFLVVNDEEANLVDVVRGPLSLPPALPMTVLPIEFSGISISAKLTKLRATFQSGAQPVDALVLCALDDIAWLLNVRGADVPFNPVWCVHPLHSLIYPLTYL